MIRIPLRRMACAPIIALALAMPVAVSPMLTSPAVAAWMRRRSVATSWTPQPSTPLRVRVVAVNQVYLINWVPRTLQSRF